MSGLALALICFFMQSVLCYWQMTNGGPQQTRYVEAMPTSLPSFQWSFPINKAATCYLNGVSMNRVGEPVISWDLTTVYVPTYVDMAALRRSDGSLLWRYSTGSSVCMIISLPDGYIAGYAAGGLVFILSSNGTLIKSMSYSAQTCAKESVPPLVLSPSNETYLYFQSFVLEASTGDVLFNIPNVTNQATPIAATGSDVVLYFDGTTCANIVAIKVDLYNQTSEFLWRYTTRGAMSGVSVQQDYIAVSYMMMDSFSIIKWSETSASETLYKNFSSPPISHLALSQASSASTPPNILFTYKDSSQLAGFSSEGTLRFILPLSSGSPDVAPIIAGDLLFSLNSVYDFTTQLSVWSLQNISVLAQSVLDSESVIVIDNLPSVKYFGPEIVPYEGHTVAIVLGVFGGLLAIVLALLALVYWRNYKQTAEVIPLLKN